MSAREPTVEILLGTYNGGRHLPEQLRSLERQTFRDWRLIARDDGSSDATPALLAEFRAKHPAAVRLVADGRGRLGPAGNFTRLLEEATGDYGLFCDQDDVWRPAKIEHLLTVARWREPAPGPLLVHSDLEVVDDELRLLADSLWRYQLINPAHDQSSRLLVQNVVTGCACLFNAALRLAALPVPPEAIMHDWWLALVAAAAGEIRWTRERTVCYRQHGGNDTGAKRWGAAYVLRHAREFFAREAFRGKVATYQRQAAALDRHPGLPPAAAPARAVARKFAGLRERSYPQRVRMLLRHRILKTGLLRNLALLARI